MEVNNELKYSKNQIKYGVLTFYLCQGLCFASWASRIPDVKNFYNVSDNFIWGLILFLIPVGKFISIPLSGYSVPKYGSRLMVQVAVIGYAVALFLIGITPNIYTLGISLFLFGVFWNLTDISLNTQGIDIERILGKTSMGIFHGAWSLAACIGALIGFIMINLKIDQFYHFSAIAILIIASSFYNKKFLQKDVAQAEQPIEEVKEAIKEETHKGKFKMPEKILLQLGLIGLFALIVESAMFDWGNVYFETTVKAPKTLQIGFLVFMVMMTTGRFLTNTSYNFFGKQRTIQIAGFFIFAGMFMSALLSNVVFSSIGFMLVGLGISCMVPTIYSVVGEKSKTPTGMALTILSTISFIGSLIAPLLIGGLSKQFDLKFAYMIVGILGLIIVLLTTFTNAMKESNK